MIKENGLGTKDLNGRQIYNVSGVPRAKVPWGDLPSTIQNNLEIILNYQDLKRAPKKPGSESRVFIVNWVTEDKTDWTNHINFGVRYGKLGFRQQGNSITLNVIYNLLEEKDDSKIVPAELWVCNNEGAGWMAGENVYLLDKRVDRSIKEYARKAIPRKAA